MKQHPIPQNVLDVEFKLFTKFTVREFAYIAIGFGFGGIFIQIPRAGAFTDGVPCPNRVAVNPIHQFYLNLYAVVGAGNPNPVIINDAFFGSHVLVYVKTVAVGNLPEPGILRTP